MSDKMRTFNPFAYGLPKPELDVRKTCPGFETPRDSRQERDTRIKRLERSGGLACRELAEKLRRCEQGRRCLSPSCPGCSRRFRIWFVEQVMVLYGDEEKLLFVTIIPPGSEVPGEGLHDLYPKRLGDTLRQQIARAGIKGQIVGGIDGEYDEQKQVWRPHFHLIAPASGRQAFHDLKERFYANPLGTYRPLHTRAVDNLPKAASYCVKTFWPSRRGYTDRDRNPRTADCRLGGDLGCDWLVWRDGFQLENFIFLYGVRRYGDELRPIAVSDKIAKDQPKGLVEHSKGAVAPKDSG